mmetsp:Transcript_19444/g.58749  ORF Transcript_19444/g.58749 Transcript_19444/m.58749 type:complete len:228 (-) Transcript_19444:205-888(-)
MSPRLATGSGRPRACSRGSAGDGPAWLLPTRPASFSSDASIISFTLACALSSSVSACPAGLSANFVTSAAAAGSSRLHQSCTSSTRAVISSSLPPTSGGRRRSQPTRKPSSTALPSSRAVPRIASGSRSSKTSAITTAAAAPLATSDLTISEAGTLAASMLRFGNFANRVPSARAMLSRWPLIPGVSESRQPGASSSERLGSKVTSKSEHRSATCPIASSLSGAAIR